MHKNNRRSRMINSQRAYKQWNCSLFRSFITIVHTFALRNYFTFIWKWGEIVWPPSTAKRIAAATVAEGLGSKRCIVHAHFRDSNSCGGEITHFSLPHARNHSRSLHARSEKIAYIWIYCDAYDECNVCRLEYTHAPTGRSKDATDWQTEPSEMLAKRESECGHTKRP